MPSGEEKDDQVPQLPPFYSPRPIPVSRTISELDLNSQIGFDSLDLNAQRRPRGISLSASSVASSTQDEANLPGLLSPAFTPPSTPGTHTPALHRPAKSVVVNSADPQGGCGSRKPKLMEELPIVHCVVRARIPTVNGSCFYLHLYL